MSPALQTLAPTDRSEVRDAWYLDVVTEATAAHLDALGHSAAVLADLGVVHRAVHTDLDWADRAGPGSAVTVTVACAHVGHTSMTLDARIDADGHPVCHVRVVHVLLVAADPATRAEVPESLRTALGPARPLKPQGRAARG